MPATDWPFPDRSVPVWVCWVAQDSDGSWWGYSVQPLRHDTGWYENEVGRCLRLGTGPVRDWEGSLCKFPPVVG